MNTMATISTATESKWANPSSQVENPPSPIVVAMWHQASNQSSPTGRALAVLAMRGVSRSSFMGPGGSARTTW
ncbi:hypothetical protein G6F46_014931 [Rhizopus delemar]|nr:hypothetical protein G6F46_014931 [Rhizopus delemar]